MKALSIFIAAGLFSLNSSAFSLSIGASAYLSFGSSYDNSSSNYGGDDYGYQEASYSSYPDCRVNLGWTEGSFYPKYGDSRCSDSSYRYGYKSTYKQPYESEPEPEYEPPQKETYGKKCTPKPAPPKSVVEPMKNGTPCEAMETAKLEELIGAAEITLGANELSIKEKAEIEAEVKAIEAKTSNYNGGWFRRTSCNPEAAYAAAIAAAEVACSEPNRGGLKRMADKQNAGDPAELITVRGKFAKVALSEAELKAGKDPVEVTVLAICKFAEPVEKEEENCEGVHKNTYKRDRGYKAKTYKKTYRKTYQPRRYKKTYTKRYTKRYKKKRYSGYRYKRPYKRKRYYSSFSLSGFFRSIFRPRYYPKKRYSRYGYGGYSKRHHHRHYRKRYRTRSFRKGYRRGHRHARKHYRRGFRRY